MYVKRTEHAIVCDTCRGSDGNERRTYFWDKRIWAEADARQQGWELHTGLQRCRDCVINGRTERVR